MSKNILYIILLALLGTSLSSNAQKVRRVVLKNGNEYTGYVKSQKLAEGTMIFSAEQSKEKYYLAINDSSSNTNKAKYFVDSVKHDISIQYDNIKEIRVVKQNTISGIEREYTFANGKAVKGAYAGEIPGEKVFLLNSSNQEIVVNLSDVVKQNYYPRNVNQKLFHQALLLDRVIKKNGNGDETGLIIEKNYEDEEKSYIILETDIGEKKTILFDEIAELSTIINKNYDPIQMNVLDRGKMMVNGEIIKSYTSPVKFKGNWVVSDKGKGHRAEITAKDSKLKIILEINDPDNFADTTSVELVHMTFINDPRGYQYGEKAKREQSFEFHKDDRSGTAQYIFQISIPRVQNKDKEHPFEYVYGLDLKDKGVIPVLVTIDTKKEIKNNNR